jgi:hypothetical protein
LMKKVLQEGKCDHVPGHILELQNQMHVEWLGQRTPGQLSTRPNVVFWENVEGSKPYAGLSHKKVLGRRLIPFLWVGMPFLWRRPPVGTLLESRRVFRTKRASKSKRDKMHTDYLNALHLKDQVKVPMQPSEGGRPRGPC